METVEESQNEISKTRELSHTERLHGGVLYIK